MLFFWAARAFLMKPWVYIYMNLLLYITVWRMAEQESGERSLYAGEWSEDVAESSKNRAVVSGFVCVITFLVTTA